MLDNFSYTIRYFNLSDLLANFGDPARWECPIQQGIPILFNLAFIAILWIAVNIFINTARGTIFWAALGGGSEESTKKARESYRNLFIGAGIFILSAWFVVLFIRGLTDQYYNIFNTSIAEGPFRLVDEENVPLFRCQRRDTATLANQSVDKPDGSQDTFDREATDRGVAEQLKLTGNKTNNPTPTSKRVSLSKVENPDVPLSYTMFNLDPKYGIPWHNETEAFGSQRDGGLRLHRGTDIPVTSFRFPFKAYVVEAGEEETIEKQTFVPDKPKTKLQPSQLLVDPFPGRGIVRLFVPEFKKTFIFRNIDPTPFVQYKPTATKKASLLSENALTITARATINSNIGNKDEDGIHMEILEGDPDRVKIGSSTWQLEAKSYGRFIDPYKFLSSSTRQAWAVAGFPPKK